MDISKIKDTDFYEVDTGVNSGAVYSSIERGKDHYGQQTEASESEKQARRAAGKTQGRKGCHMDRVNISLTPDNHHFVKTMSVVAGMNMTEFINFVLSEYQRLHVETYKKAEEIYKELLENRPGAEK